MEKKRVIIAGSSGMIGSLILSQCLAREDVSQVTILVRRASGISHPRLVEVIHNDFLDYKPVEAFFRNQDVCFFCIGVYTGQVPADEFTRITVDYTKAFGDMLKRQSPRASFCFLSGQGADAKEKSRILFAREKGKAENYLLNLKFPAAYIFRPGYIYPVTPRHEPNISYRIFRVLYKYVFAFVLPAVGVSSEQLAKAMVNTGLNGGDRVIYENAAIRKYKDG
jgi:nucleoside-diphosphate-sugar epimerase